VKWQAVPGKKYQLETVASLLGTPVFQPVGEVVIAGAGQYELDTLVQVPADAPLGVLRIQLVTQ
jgi:hypothetical protein